MPKADAVFEGGGVRGIGHVGALAYAENELGYEWQNVAGTSAGAIIAALVAAEYKADEIRDIIWNLDFNQLMDEAPNDSFLDKLMSLGKIIPKYGPMIAQLPSIVSDFGMYKGDRFLKIAEGHLLAKGVNTFGDLRLGDDEIEGVDDEAELKKYRYRLRVIASDLTAQRMLVLPDDIAEFGIEPDELSVAKSLRMSMSIPFFFEPVRLTSQKDGTEHIIVDGGVLSNYPIWLYDTPEGKTPEWPTLGFNLYQPASAEDENPLLKKPRDIDTPIQFAQALWDVMFSAADRRYIRKKHWARTIPIDTVGVGTTDFDITEADKQRLWESGQSAARGFFDKWDFEGYLREWRS